MSKRKLAITYAEATDEGKTLRLTFNRPLTFLESEGITAIVKALLERKS
jgi:hypothetical protein